MSDKEIIAHQAEKIAQLESSLQAALRKIAELEARLGRTAAIVVCRPLVMV